MKINRKEALIEFDNGIFISYWQCLTEIFKMNKFNWSTFQFINIEFENDRACQHYEITLGLLCCGIRIVIPTHPKEEHVEHKKIREAISTLRESCHGWVNAKDYKNFRTKLIGGLIVKRKRTKGYRKRLFIQ